MKLNDRQAAFLYYLIFNLIQNSTEITRQQLRMIDKVILGHSHNTKHYPTSDSTIFDNDGMPVVVWQDESFVIERFLFSDSATYDGEIRDELNDDAEDFLDDSKLENLSRILKKYRD